MTFCKLKLRAIVVREYVSKDVWVYHAEDEDASCEDPTNHEKFLAEAQSHGSLDVVVTTFTLSTNQDNLNRLFEGLGGTCKIEKTP